MNDEELAALQEELAEARVELELLRTTVADREARAAHVEAQLSESTEREAALIEQARNAAVRYREIALEHSPELPADLVTGESIEDIDTSIERARETVARVRGHIESQAQASRVPAGAPERGPADVSALSAEEKIRMGLRSR